MNRLQELMAFVQQKGFVWGPEPEIYGGLAGFYTYAPLGKLLKNQVEQAIRRTFSQHQFWEVECPTIMPAKVWEASGHLRSFTDDIVTCSKCQASFKAESVAPEGKTLQEIMELIRHKQLVCPSCKAPFQSEAKKHNLMMQTTVGMDAEAFLRPETATTTYLPFIRYYDFFRKKLPFSVFQIGKAYRNEVNPRQHIIRMREFTQAEAQVFLSEAQKEDFHLRMIKETSLPLQPHTQNEPTPQTLKEALKQKHFQTPAYAWTVALAYDVFINMGIPADRIRIRQHSPDERAFYALDAWDLEVRTESFGWIEMCGIHDRGDYDLKQHGTSSGQNFEVLDPHDQKVLPHVLEIAFGVDRPVFALLDIFYDKKEKGQGKTVFRIPARLAPVKAAILPLVKKDKLPEIGKAIHAELLAYYPVTYDESGSIGKRYLREAEAGTPLCITVDFETLEDDAVTLRERDTEKQVRVPIKQLKTSIEKYLAGTSFMMLGKPIKL